MGTLVKKAPSLRFPGFVGDWEQRKCEGILKPTKGAMKIGPFGSALKKEFYTETGVKVYAQENIFQEDFTIGNYYISEDRYQTLKGCKLEPGDLVISMMGTIGACAIFPENAEPGIMNSHLLRLQLNDDIYPEYIHQLLRDSQIIRSQIDKLSVGSIMSGLSSSVVQKLVFPIPSIDEQKKIAVFLSQLDNIITLHQRKCDEMKTLKSAMLQKMFPKEGKKTPEIRFPGFYGEWGRRRLGDVFKEYSDKGHIDLPALMIIQGGGTVRRDEADRNLQYDKANLSNYKKVNVGDFIVHLRSFEGGLELATTAGVISPAYHTLHGELADSRFYYAYFRSAKFINSDLKPHVYGIRDGRSIDVDGMKSIRIPYPSFEEQKKIGEFLDKLDNSILFQQRKCGALKKLKKALLQQMFV